MICKVQNKYCCYGQGSSSQAIGASGDMSSAFLPQSASQMVPGGYDLFCIGDAAGSRNVQAATFDALRLCQNI